MDATVATMEARRAMHSKWQIIVLTLIFAVGKIGRCS